MSEGEAFAVEDDFFENAPCGYALLRLDGRITEANAAFWRLIGRSADKLGTLHFQQVLSRAGGIY